MNRGPFLLSNRGGGGHPTASLIYPTACSCLKPSCLCQHTHTHTHKCSHMSVICWYSANCCFCQSIVAVFGLTPEWQPEPVLVCLRGQGDESGPYLLLISAGHHLYLKLTLFIVVTHTKHKKALLTQQHCDDGNNQRWAPLAFCLLFLSCSFLVLAGILFKLWSPLIYM